MSEIIFADTSFLIAFYNKKDDKHPTARLLVQNLIHHRTSVAFIITDYIFDGNSSPPWCERNNFIRAFLSVRLHVVIPRN